MKATITFEVSKNKTVVIATGTTGNVDTTDITGTSLEKEFTVLLRKLREYQISKQVEDAVDISKWQEV